MSFTKVMAAVDWDEASAAVVIETARRAAGGRPVEIVHVLDQGYYLNTIDPASASIEDLRAKASSEAEAYLQGLCDRHGGTYALLEGYAATVLHEHAESGGHGFNAHPVALAVEQQVVVSPGQVGVDYTRRGILDRVLLEGFAHNERPGDADFAY